MADLLFIAMMFAFFGLAVVLIRICDRIIGADEARDIVVVGSVEYGAEAADAAYKEKVTG
jgi:hypothetical protein